jgi:rare lipoprotein A
MASWYGGRYHGRTTASGEIFDKNAITAAHRTLPFGSWVQVTNLANGRSMTVKINDRGPFIDGRIIDVSRQVAERLGFIQQGVTRVRVRLVRRNG